METQSLYDQQYIIYNGALGISDFVMIDRVENNSEGNHAWLEEPYDMVGPFSIDELQTHGKIKFAKCIVMSRKYWQKNQQLLKADSFKRQNKIREEMFENLKRKNRQRHNNFYKSNYENEKRYREILSLPLDCILDTSQIKKAFKKVSKKVHPDAGGSHDDFVNLNMAKDELLALFS